VIYQWLPIELVYIKENYHWFEFSLQIGLPSITCNIGDFICYNIWVYLLFKQFNMTYWIRVMRVHYGSSSLCRVPVTLGKGLNTSVTLGTEHSAKNLWAIAECLLLGTRQREMKKCEKKAECLLSGKSRQFSRKIRGYAVGGIQTRDLSLARYLLYHLHYTPTCVYMLF
jgi:hypothetical protein